MAKIWTEENEEFIRENFRHKTYAELAEHFGVTQKAMESKIRRMGLKKQDPPAEAPPPFTIDVEEPEAEPEETGPTPIRTLGSLPRRAEIPEETPEERAERMEAEREAAEEEKVRREEERGEKTLAGALKHFEAGLKKYHDGSFVKAREEFEAVLKAATGDQLLDDRARQYMRVVDRKRKRSSFRPQDADEYYLQGVLLLNDGDPSGALKSFAAALERAPGDDRILYCQAAAQAQRGDVEAAIAALREAIETNESNRVYALNDPDFVPLRVHEDFKSLVRRDTDAGRGG